MVKSDVREELERLVKKYNRPEFIDADPVQFPRRFSDQRDIEIVSLLVSTIAWGNRTMICRDSERLLALMDYKPYEYVNDRGYEELPDQNIHRTFFAANLRHYLRGLHKIYADYGTLEGFARAKKVGNTQAPAWALAEEINKILAQANDGIADSRCLPLNLKTSALKRFNMALRWLVRNDGIVDMGIWTEIKPSQLFIPLDVHVANVSRAFGILTRKSNDRKAVEEITSQMRILSPDDPAKYDFALFGLGVDAKNS